MTSDRIAEELTAAGLEARWRGSIDTEEQTDFNDRMRRATSWLERAAQEESDMDAEFIFYWIAFNSAYGGNGYAEKEAFRNFFRKILALGAGREILDKIRRQCPEAIASFRDNEYVFPKFWTENTHQGTHPSEWEHLFISSNHKIDEGIKNGNAQDVLEELFDRLYVLRNQLLHGSATWKGGVNRRQVENGAVIMRLLIPSFINTMLDNPAEEWGEPYYSPHRAWQHNTPKI